MIILTFTRVNSLDARPRVRAPLFLYQVKGNFDGIILKYLKPEVFLNSAFGCQPNVPWRRHYLQTVL